MDKPKRKIERPPDNVKDIKVGPGNPGKHWSILDGMKDELAQKGYSGIVISVEPDEEGKKKVSRFLADHNVEGTPERPYLIIQHDTKAKRLLELALAAGLHAELFEAKK